MRGRASRPPDVYIRSSGRDQGSANRSLATPEKRTCPKRRAARQVPGAAACGGVPYGGASPRANVRTERYGGRSAEVRRSKTTSLT